MEKPSIGEYGYFLVTHITCFTGLIFGRTILRLPLCYLMCMSIQSTITLASLMKNLEDLFSFVFVFLLIMTGKCLFQISFENP